MATRTDDPVELMTEEWEEAADPYAEVPEIDDDVKAFLIDNAIPITIGAINGPFENEIEGKVSRFFTLVFITMDEDGLIGKVTIGAAGREEMFLRGQEKTRQGVLLTGCRLARVPMKPPRSPMITIARSRPLAQLEQDRERYITSVQKLRVSQGRQIEARKGGKASSDPIPF